MGSQDKASLSVQTKVGRSALMFIFVKDCECYILLY